MANVSISAMTLASAVVGTNELEINEGGVTKKINIAQIKTYLQGGVGMQRVYALAADHAISSITATEVTGLGPMTLEAGTYVFQISILAQSATTTVTPMFGINFTGTAAVRSFTIQTLTTGTTAITGVADSAGATTGQTMEGVSSITFSTTAPNLGFTGGVDTINTNILYIINGMLIVTVAGDLELWHGSETATSTTVKAGTSAIITRTA